MLIRCTIIHEFSISVMKKSKFYTCVYLRKENEIVNRRWVVLYQSLQHIFIYPASRGLSYPTMKLSFFSFLRGDMKGLCSQGNLYFLYKLEKAAVSCANKWNSRLTINVWHRGPQLAESQHSRSGWFCYWWWFCSNSTDRCRCSSALGVASNIESVSSHRFSILVI